MNSRAEAQPIGAVSSGVEHYLDTVGVTSSNLVSPTICLRNALRTSGGRF